MSTRKFLYRIRSNARTVPSRLALKTACPEGRNATADTGPECSANVTKHDPVLALHTFTDLLEGAAVFFHIDNVSSMHILKNGAARADDHNLLSYACWMFLCQADISGWLEWVPSHLNIADGPTRCDWEIYQILKPCVRPAVLDKTALDLSSFIEDMLW